MSLLLIGLAKAGSGRRDLVTTLLIAVASASTTERHGHHVESFPLLIARRILPLVAVAFLLLVWYCDDLEGASSIIICCHV
jgi:hypothetical protein